MGCSHDSLLYSESGQCSFWGLLQAALPLEREHLQAAIQRIPCLHLAVCNTECRLSVSQCLYELLLVCKPRTYSIDLHSLDSKIPLLPGFARSRNVQLYVISFDPAEVNVVDYDRQF